MKFTKTKKVLLIVLIVIVVAIVAIKNMKVPEVNLAVIDFSALADGTYPGTYVLGPVKASVEVDVLGGIVTQIRMTEHRRARTVRGRYPGFRHSLSITASRYHHRRHLEQQHDT